MDGQKKSLEQVFDNWKAWADQNGTSQNLEQVDGVLVMGIRI